MGKQGVFQGRAKGKGVIVVFITKEMRWVCVEVKRSFHFVCSFKNPSSQKGMKRVITNQSK